MGLQVLYRGMRADSVKGSFLLVWGQGVFGLVISQQHDSYNWQQDVQAEAYHDVRVQEEVFEKAVVDKVKNRP